MTREPIDIRRARLAEHINELYHKDHCTLAGASRSAEHIKDFWAAQGHAVQTWIVTVAFNSSTRSTTYAVRTDMINGLPRAMLGRAA